MVNISKNSIDFRFTGEFLNNQKHGYGVTIKKRFLDNEDELTQSIFFKLKN